MHRMWGCCWRTVCFLFAILSTRIVDNRSEWRTFGSNDKANGADPSRVGGPQDNNDDGLAALRTSVMPGGLISFILSDLKVLEKIFKSGRLGMQYHKPYSFLTKRCLVPSVVDRWRFEKSVALETNSIFLMLHWF
jgi:hypothetical protein